MKAVSGMCVCVIPLSVKGTLTPAPPGAERLCLLSVSVTGLFSPRGGSEPSALGCLCAPSADTGERVVSQMGPIWKGCQLEKEEAGKRLSLIAVTKDVVPTGLVKDGWHYHREVLTESETLVL